MRRTVLLNSMFNTQCFCIRSEEHTSELQSRTNLVCRLLLEKKKKQIKNRLLDIRKGQLKIKH